MHYIYFRTTTRVWELWAFTRHSLTPFLFFQVFKTQNGILSNVYQLCLLTSNNPRFVVIYCSAARTILSSKLHRKQTTPNNTFKQAFKYKLPVLLFQRCILINNETAEIVHVLFCIHLCVHWRVILKTPTVNSFLCCFITQSILFHGVIDYCSVRFPIGNFL